MWSKKPMPVAISRTAAAVEIDFEPDFGFRRFPLDGGRARHDGMEILNPNIEIRNRSKIQIRNDRNRLKHLHS